MRHLLGVPSGASLVRVLQSIHGNEKGRLPGAWCGVENVGVIIHLLYRTLCDVVWYGVGNRRPRHLSESARVRFGLADDNTASG